MLLHGDGFERDHQPRVLSARLQSEQQHMKDKQQWKTEAVKSREKPNPLLLIPIPHPPVGLGKKPCGGGWVKVGGGATASHAAAGGGVTVGGVAAEAAGPEFHLPRQPGRVEGAGPEPLWPLQRERRGQEPAQALDNVLPLCHQFLLGRTGGGHPHKEFQEVTPTNMCSFRASSVGKRAANETKVRSQEGHRFALPQDLLQLSHQHGLQQGPIEAVATWQGKERG